jgi:hypothetical protein
MDDIRQIVTQVDSISSVDDAAQLRQLIELMDRYFQHPNAKRHLEVWFRLYERFPEDDGYETFWTILHGIEAQHGFEKLVIESVKRRPSQFPLLMINRMMNAGDTRVGSTELIGLLEMVAADENCITSVREDARGFLEWQKSKKKKGK